MIETLNGACLCGQVRFHLMTDPIVTHACHCTQCQRVTGSAFAVNLMIEADRVTVEAGEITRTEDGQAACPRCGTRLWGYHPMFGERAAFVKAGVLAGGRTPDVHCFTSTKQPWLPLPEGAPAYEEHYDFEAVLGPEQQARAAALLPSLDGEGQAA
jgi:hypothetical protein